MDVLTTQVGLENDSDGSGVGVHGELPSRVDAADGPQVAGRGLSGPVDVGRNAVVHLNGVL